MKAYLVLLISLIFTVGCKQEKTKNHLPFSSKIEGGDLCMLLHPKQINELIYQKRILKDFPPGIETILSHTDISSLLNLRTDSLFVVSNLKKLIIYGEINDSKSIDEQRRMWLMNKTTQLDSIANFALFKWESEHVGIAYNDSCFILTHKYDIDQKVNSFINQKTASGKWKEVLKAKSENNNIFAYYSTPDMDSLGVSAILHDTFVDENLAFQIKVNSKEELPFVLENIEKGYRQGNIALNLKFQSKTDNFIEDLLDKAGAKFGLSLKDLTRSEQGVIRFFKGGELSVQKEIIESKLDENFNMIEVKKTITEKVPGFLLEVEGNSKKLQTELMEKGILRKEGKDYQLLYQPALKLSSSEETFRLSTSKDLPSYIMQPPAYWMDLEFLELAVNKINYSPKQLSFTITYTKNKAIQ